MSVKYYKSAISGLSVVIGQPDREKGEVAPKTVRFTPYLEKENGDSVKVGYLQTEDTTVQGILKHDSNVVAIEKDEFDKATGDKAIELGY
jgi:ethanolamine utilization protein EutQ (cupin superfamily)